MFKFTSLGIKKDALERQETSKDNIIENLKKGNFAIDKKEL